MQFGQLKRRDFISVLGGAVAWPLAARAQQAAMPLVGFLGPASAAGYVPFLTAFREGLSASGYVEGRNVTIEYRWANDRYDLLPALATDLVNRRVSALATGGATAAALAAKNATTTIPVVFSIGADPVKFGLVASLNRPGGNVTGVSFLANALMAKRLEVLGELLPGTDKFAVLINPSNPNAVSDTQDVLSAASALGRQVFVVKATEQRELDEVFNSLTRQQARALLVLPDALFTSRPQQLSILAAHHRLPAIYPNRLFSDAGGLMSYGTDQLEAYREAGRYVGRILKGERPSDLPVVQSTKFEFVINLKTARTLGIDIPAKLLAIADEVIE
jgi:putative tryptophan/tyrosine transport system substrate-binding protein